MDDITQYFPYYPDADNPNFEMLINRKKEFNELQDQALNDIPFELKTYQKFANRYISGYTLYDQILVANDMGTGKTLLAISIVEEYKRSFFRTGFNYGQMKKALIIVKSEETAKNFEKEIFENSYSGYLYRKADNTNDKKLMRTIYNIKTYTEFFNEYGKDQQAYVNNFSNSVVIIDEVHNLRVTGNSKNAEKQYNRIHEFLHNIKKSKIVLMTGTPMRDKAHEIAEVYNLILPLDEQFETRGEFDAEYLDDTTEFKKKIRGRTVSLKSLEEKNVTKVFVSNEIEDSDLDVNVFYEEMNDHQGAAYIKAFDKDGGSKNIDSADQGDGDDDKKGALYQNSKQAINFVYPDESYGSEGYNKYVIESVKKNKEERKLKYKLVEEFKEYIRSEIQKLLDTDVDEYQQYNNLSFEYKKKLKVIGRLSVSYHDAILGLLTDFGKSLIFLELINGSGCRIFSLLLELFGFSAFSKDEGIESDKRRYILITGAASGIADTIEYFNDESNWDGSKIKVIIGTKTISESYSLKDVRHVRILMPFWNFAIVHQTLARAFRIGSFTYTREKLGDQKGDQKDQKIDVKIYYHCPYYRDINESFTYKLYTKSYEKERKIRIIMRAIREASIDCYVNREINMKGIDNSPECDYTSCNYECDNIDTNQLNNLKESDLDYTTYLNFYIDEVERYVIAAIRSVFRTRNEIKFEDLANTVVSIVKNDTVLLKILHSIVHNLIPINNRFDEPCFLKQYNNIYFIVRDQRYDIDQLLINNDGMSYYATNKITTKYNTFDKLLAYVEAQNVQMIVDKAKKKETLEDVKAVLDTIDGDKLLAVLQRAVEDKNDGKKEFAKRVCDAYSKEIWEDNQIIVVNVKGKSKCFDIATKTWRDCKGSESTKKRTEIIAKRVEERKDIIFMGTMDDNKFRIKCINLGVTDARKDTKGSATLLKPPLAFICHSIGMRWQNYIDIKKVQSLVDGYNSKKTEEEKLQFLQDCKDKAFSKLDPFAKNFAIQNEAYAKALKNSEALLSMCIFYILSQKDLMKIIQEYMVANKEVFML